jgi:hypothetical protein
LQKVNPPAGAHFISHDSTSKPSNAFAGNEYVADSTLEDVVQHYTKELTSQGFTYRRERRLQNGELVVDFCGSIYGAKIDSQHPDVRPLTYTVYFDWGLTEC